MDASDLRIVLLGKTGVGKSASGNTILGNEEFVEESSPESVTRQCKKFETKVSGRKVVVLDSPGLFDTSLTNKELKQEIVKCVHMTVPGPHVFLLVISLRMRFTEEERNTMKWIQQTFSKLALKYAMVLFTGMDSINTEIEDYIDKSAALKQLITECGGRYHVFDNTKKDRTQVTRLLAKIDKMVAANGGQHYTDQMYQEAQRMIREEEERKKKEEERKRQEEERKRQEVQRKREEALQQEWERKERQRREEDRKRFEEEKRQRAEEEIKRREEDRREYERRRVEERKMFEEQEKKKQEALQREWERREAQNQAHIKKIEEENRQKIKEEQERREKDRREYERRIEEEERRRREEEDKKKENEKKNPFNIAGKILMTVPALVGGAAVGLGKAIVEVPVGMWQGMDDVAKQKDLKNAKGTEVPGAIVELLGGEIQGGVKEVAKAPKKVIDGAFGAVNSLWD